MLTVRTAQGGIYDRLHVSKRIPRVVPRPCELQSIHRAIAEHFFVREIDVKLGGIVHRDGLKVSEDIGREEEFADDTEPRRGILRAGPLRKVGDFVDIAVLLGVLGDTA